MATHMIKLFHKGLNFINKIIVQRLISDQNNYSKIAVATLNIYNKDHNRVYKIKNFNNLKPFYKIKSGYSYISKSQDNVKIKIPDLNYYKLKNTIINSRSSAIVMGKNIYYEGINENERFNEGFIKHHDKNKALVNHNDTEYIKEGFFLAGNGSYNWYHWLIEILPKVMYMKTEHTKILLVDQACKDIPTMAESLKIFTDDKLLEVIYLDPLKSYKVKTLHLINEVNKLMYNLLNTEIKIFPIYYFRKDSLLNFVKILKKKVHVENFQAERIYLARVNTHRVPANEKEIEILLNSRKFKNVDLTSLNFNNQISIFDSAKIIVGTTGAGATNILFANANAEICIFTPSNYKDYKYFSELALMLNLHFTYIYYDNDAFDHTNSRFSININFLRDFLNKKNV